MDEALKLAGLDEIPVDSQIIVEGENIKKLLIGVDMQTAEILLAKQLGFDCVVSHHPVGDFTFAHAAKILRSQIDSMVKWGVPINKAQKAIQEAYDSSVSVFHVVNYDRYASAARLLNMPYLGIHQPSDLIGERVIQERLDKQLAGKEKATLQEVVDALKGIDEFAHALTEPIIAIGSPESYAGKVMVMMSGGTDGGAPVHKAYFEAGIGTLVVMHVPDNVIKTDKELGIGNIVVAGHMASDSVGLNRIIRRWEELGLEVTRMSGVIE
jgi:putative NIF3 family GTP cyclohydrolase 1 type 2